MTISELIDQLHEILANEGDVPVYLYNYENGTNNEIEEVYFENASKKKSYVVIS